MTTKAYLAGPIQHASDHGKGWRERLKKGDISHSGEGIEFIDPMDKYNTHEMEETEWKSETIIDDDLKLIINSDVIIVHWREVPTCGTPMEVLFTKRIPQIGEAMLSLASQLAKERGTDGTVEFFNAAEEAGMKVDDIDILLMAAKKEEIPIVVQTSIEPDNISPWMTYHADVLVEDFKDGVNWIENEINDGDAPEPNLLDGDYDLVTV